MKKDITLSDPAENESSISNTEDWKKRILESAPVQSAGKLDVSDRPRSHFVSISEDDTLCVEWRGHQIAHLPKKVGNWDRLRLIDNGLTRLASYFDKMAINHGYKNNGLPNISYYSHAIGWTNKTYNAWRKKKREKAKISKIVNKPNLNIHLETKEIFSGDAYHDVLLPSMDHSKSHLTGISIGNADEISAIIGEIWRVIDAGYSHVGRKAREKILAEAFRSTLEFLKADVRNRALPQITLPAEAKTAYVPRESGKASEFLVKHWGEFIDAGVCFRPDIKRLDPKLEQALANEFRGRTDELRALLPTKQDEVDRRLASEFGRPIRPEDRKAAVIAAGLSQKIKHQF